MTSPIPRLALIFWGVILPALVLSSVTAQARDYSDLFARLDPSVVTIQTAEIVTGATGIGQRQGIGSGVLIDADGLIMTAAHVVHTADRVYVKFKTGEVARANVVSSVRNADVALLKVSRLPKNAKVAKLGDADLVRVGQEALAIGAPLGIEHSLSIGHVSGKQKRPVVAGGDQLELIQTDAAINKGNSGGPLFNTAGEVIGIVSHILSQSGGSIGIGFAVSINAAQRILLERSPFWSGFEGEVLTPQLAKILNVPQGGGLLVQRVLPDSAAGRAGLKGGTTRATLFGKPVWLGGDVILAIQGIPCTGPHDFDEIRTALNTLRPNESIEMSVLRQGTIVTVKLQNS